MDGLMATLTLLIMFVFAPDLAGIAAFGAVIYASLKSRSIDPSGRPLSRPLSGPHAGTATSMRPCEASEPSSCSTASKTAACDG